MAREGRMIGLMRKTLRIFFWMIKGLLLLIALAALVMWPVSCGRTMGVSAERFTAGPFAGERRWYTAECRDGRAVVNRHWRYAWGDPELASIRAEVESGGEAWHWYRGSAAYKWDAGAWPARWGPLRWRFTDYNGPDAISRYRVVAAPPWTIALVTGVWPALSYSLVAQRRLRRSRAKGLCVKCGDDLRATPTPPADGGEVLDTEA